MDEENQEDVVVDPPERRTPDNMTMDSTKPHFPAQLLNIFSAGRLMILLVLLSITHTNFFAENSTNTWPKPIRLGISLVEFIYFFLGLIAFVLSLFYDPKRQNILFFAFFKTLEFLFSLTAASLIISDLLEDGIKTEAGFVSLSLSLFISKICDITYVDKAYGGFTNFSNTHGNQDIQHTGNFNISCCPYGFYYARNYEGNRDPEAPHERTPLVPHAQPGAGLND